MKYYLIADKDNNIIILQGMIDTKIVKTTLEILKNILI